MQGIAAIKVSKRRERPLLVVMRLELVRFGRFTASFGLQQALDQAIEDMVLARRSHRLSTNRAPTIASLKAEARALADHPVAAASHPDKSCRNLSTKALAHRLGD